MKERHHRNILSVASFDICRYCPCCLTFLYRSYRVDLSKEKRKYRMAKSKKIVMTITGLNYDEATIALDNAKGHVKTALVMVKANVDLKTAKERLKKADGFVRKAIEG